MSSLVLDQRLEGTSWLELRQHRSPPCPSVSMVVSIGPRVERLVLGGDADAGLAQIGPQL